jgi:cytosine/uracil/thiamine/allantoin permease
MSYLNIRPNATFWRPALIIGIISVVGALYSGILDKFTDWILLIGGLFTPIFAILITDFLFIKKRNLNIEALSSGEENEYWYTGGYNVIAWVVYFISAGLAYYWIKINPLDIGATVPVFITAFVGYLILYKLFTKSKRSIEEPIKSN